MNLPWQLLAWLQRVLPGVDLARVRLTFADRLPFDWVSAKKDGLTLGASVYLRSRYAEQLQALRPNAIELLCHELTHVEQFAGHFFWPVLYLCQRADLEARAYQRARELRAMWEAEFGPAPGGG